MDNRTQFRTDASLRTSEIKLREYWGVLLAHRWAVALAIIVALGASIIYIRTVTPIYRAQTTLVREQEINASALFSQGAGLQSLISSATGSMEKQQVLFRSKLIVDEIVDRMTASGLPISPGKVRKNISLSSVTSSGDVLSVSATSDNPTEAMELANTTADVYIYKMSELRSTNVDRAEDFLSKQLAVVDKRLRQAEEALNTFREREGIVLVSEKGEFSGLLGQLGNLYAELSQAQNDWELGQTKLTATRQLLEEKKAEVASLGNNRLASQIESLQSLISNWRVELLTLRQTLTDKSREVIDLKEKIANAQDQLDSYFQELKEHGASIDPLSEWQSLVQESVQLEIQLRGFKQKENIVNTRIAEFKAEHPQLISEQVELTRLGRTARINEQTYMLLMDKYEETRLLKHMKTEGISVIEKATEPGSPIRPNKRSMIIWGMLMGITAGVGIAFFLEHLDNSLKVERDIEMFLGLPVVGVIPIIRLGEADLKTAKQKELLAGRASLLEHEADSSRDVSSAARSGNNKSPTRVRKSSRKRQQSLNDLLYRTVNNLEAKSPVAESYRALWTNIQFGKVDRDIKTILVTSSGPGEGKTLTAANLAITIARMGTKTLLIDTDLRRPRLHNIFGYEKKPGLSDILIGENGNPHVGSSNSGNANIGHDNDRPDVHEFIKATDVENLYLLPSGTRTPNPAEIISSQANRQLVERLKSEFDILLFDSPPLIPVTDATILASEIADISLLVVRSGETKRELAQKALELLDRVDANLFGVVLNTLDYMKRYGSYYYYYHYHYYSSEEEEE